MELIQQVWDACRSIPDLRSSFLGWWMSEKLDGVRAYWDGQNFYSRQGNLFKGCPDYFKACVIIEISRFFFLQVYSFYFCGDQLLHLVFNTSQ